MGVCQLAWKTTRGQWKLAPSGRWKVVQRERMGNAGVRFALQLYSLEDKLKKHRIRWVEHMTQIDPHRHISQVYHWKSSLMCECFTRQWPKTQSYSFLGPTYVRRSHCLERLSGARRCYGRYPLGNKTCGSSLREVRLSNTQDLPEALIPVEIATTVDPKDCTIPKPPWSQHQIWSSGPKMKTSVHTRLREAYQLPGLSKTRFVYTTKRCSLPPLTTGVDFVAKC